MRLPEHQELFFYSALGRMIRVTAVFVDAESANEHCEKHPESVIAVIEEPDGAFEVILTARDDDRGFPVERGAS